MNLLSQLYWTAKGVGWDNMPRRLLQAWRVRTGSLHRRLAAERFADAEFRKACETSPDDQARQWNERRQRFFSVPSPEALRVVADDDLWRERCTSVCDDALAGKYLMFGSWPGDLGWPPGFSRDPLNDLRRDGGRHWLDGPDSLHGDADIKLVWEASRFSLAFYFARAYARDADEKWAEAFWTMFDAWILQNPPQLTINWMCGQEMTFRLMAMLVAAFATLPSPAATPQRLEALTKLAWQTGRQLDVNINNARAQKNNHAVSEAVGLWTIGLLFPELRPAPKWRDRGRKILAAEMARQVYDDGTFVQHSMNYHRVMLDDMLWVVALSESADAPLPAAATDRFHRAAEWIREMLDPVSGRVPNYGPNDGAQVLPLNCCDYLDYRPVVQAAGYAVNRGRCLPDGPWNEKLLWLFGSDALSGASETPPREPVFAARDGGYYVLRGPNSWCMTRCHEYRDRPNQCDMSHLDLWWNGTNVLRDAGSYLYNCPEPWKSYFYATAAHNTVQIDGREQMTKGPRFLWFHWAAATLECLESSDDGRAAMVVARNDSYRRLPGRPVHRRSIYRQDDVYVIVDEILGEGEHDVALRWRLAAAEWEARESHWQAALNDGAVCVAAQGPDFDVRLVPADAQDDGCSWESLYYARREPAPSLAIRGRTALPCRLATIVASPSDLQDTHPADLEASIIHAVEGACGPALGEDP